MRETLRFGGWHGRLDARRLPGLPTATTGNPGDRVMSFPIHNGGSACRGLDLV